MSDGKENQQSQSSEDEGRGVSDFTRRMQQIEPLRDELYDYVEKWSHGHFIRHPFCNTPIIDLRRCGWIHDMIDERTRAADACFENQDWEGYIRCIEFHSQAVWLAKDAHLLADDVYWSLLMKSFIVQRCPWRQKDLFDRLFRADRPGRENLMSPEERDALALLPETLTVYRRYSADGFEGHADWIAWTLDRREAVWYANQWREAERPRLIAGKVKKSDVWAYKREGNLLLPPETVYDRKERSASSEEASAG
jgi:hypothetical protein